MSAYGVMCPANAIVLRLLAKTNIGRNTTAACCFERALGSGFVHRRHHSVYMSKVRVGGSLRVVAYRFVWASHTGPPNALVSSNKASKW